MFTCRPALTFGVVPPARTEKHNKNVTAAADARKKARAERRKGIRTGPKKGVSVSTRTEASAVGDCLVPIRGSMRQALVDAKVSMVGAVVPVSP